MAERPETVLDICTRSLVPSKAGSHESSRPDVVEATNSNGSRVANNIPRVPSKSKVAPTYSTSTSSSLYKKRTTSTSVAHTAYGDVVTMLPHGYHIATTSGSRTPIATVEVENKLSNWMARGLATTTALHVETTSRVE